MVARAFFLTDELNFGVLLAQLAHQTVDLITVEGGDVRIEKVQCSGSEASVDGRPARWQGHRGYWRAPSSLPEQDLIQIDGKIIRARSYGEYVDSLYASTEFLEPENEWAKLHWRKQSVA